MADSLLNRHVVQLLLLITLLLSACGRAPILEQHAYVFGTRVELLLAENDRELGEAAMAEVLQEFDRLHRTYHAWQPSELSRLNDAIAKGKTYTAEAEMLSFVRQAQQLSARGGHLFDPGIGRLIALWGFQADEFVAKLPSAEALQHWREKPGSVADLHIDGEKISSNNRQVALDFGGYLKGVALDRAANLLRQRGIHHALINIGGNVLALGSKNGRPWRIGIRHPREPGPLAILQLHDGEAIGTSGDYQRFFEVDGKRYSHLLDPRTAYPATETQSLTVLISNVSSEAGTYSDAFSKPLFIAGADWQRWAKAYSLRHVLRIDAEGKIEVSRDFYQRLEFINPPASLTVLDLPL